MKRLRVWWRQKQVASARKVIFGLSEADQERLMCELRVHLALRRNMAFTEISKLYPLPTPDGRTITMRGIES